MTVLNTKDKQVSKEPLFFGQELGLARYDRDSYPIFTKLRKIMKSFYWDAEEINLQKDANDFKRLEPHEKHIFTKNIAYQILLDSVQERAPLYAFLPMVSHPELEACIITWCFFEQIHSESYQWILKNLYPDPTVVFDSVLEDENIIARANSVIRYYDDFIKLANDVKVNGLNPQLLNQLKEKLYLALVSVYALEGVRFFVSFACSFSFGKRGLLTGNSNIIKLICRDELQHVAIVNNILKILRNSDDFAPIIKKLESQVYAIFEEVVQQEKDWAKYLFKDGAVIGLNEQILADYVEYTAGKRLKSIGLKSNYKANDPLPWMNDFLYGEATQVAPQETDITDYRLNILDTEIKENFLDF